MSSKGLQSVKLFLAIFPSIICRGIVSLRVFIRLKGGKLGAGEYHDSATSQDFADIALTEDILLIIAIVNTPRATHMSCIPV